MKQSEQNKCLLEETIQFQLNMEEKYPDTSIPTTFEFISPSTWTATYDNKYSDNEMIAVEWVRKKGISEDIWESSKSRWASCRLYVSYIEHEDDKYIMLNCSDGCGGEEHIIVLLKSEKLKKEKPLEK